MEQKKEDEITFEINKISSDPAVISQATNLPEEEAATAGGTYTVKVTSITHVEPAQMNQDLFDKTFGKDVVKTEEEFLNKIKETITENYKRENRSFA